MSNTDQLARFITQVLALFLWAQTSDKEQSNRFVEQAEMLWQKIKEGR